MINSENTVIVLIDIQEKLVNAVNNYNNIVSNVRILAQLAQKLDLPIIITEQYPKGLGATISEVKDFLPQKIHYVEKTSFSAYDEDIFKNHLESISCKNIVIAGIETHICIAQTAIALKNAGYNVFALTNATASRQEFEHLNGLETMKQFGVKTLTLESFLFSLLKSSKHPKFKEIQKLII